MLSCHATSLSGWAVPGSPATFSRPDQASCRKKKAQKAKSRKSARPPCGNCHTRIFLVYAFRKAGTFCESIISACDVTTDPRQKKPQQALSEPGSAAVGRSMACTQGNGICRSCFCKSHFSRRAFLCPSVLPVAADDLPVASGRLYPRRTGRLSGLFIRQEAPYRLKITLTGKNQVAFRAALGSPRRFQASSRPATLRMRRPAAGPSLFQIPTFFRPLHPGRPIRFSGAPCVFRASITVFMRPRLCLLHFRALCGSFPSPVRHFQMHPFSGFCNPRRPKRFQARTMQKGFPAALPPTLCTLPRSGFDWFCRAQAELLLCLLHLAGRLSS